MKRILIFALSLTIWGTSCKKESSCSHNNQREFNGEYRGKNLNHVAFPIGGIGAGMFCIEGTGTISHMSVKNKPEVYHTPLAFGAIHVKGVKNGTKVLEGPVPKRKIFGKGDTGNGRSTGEIGLPHFKDCSFNAKFPFAEVKLMDKDIPLETTLKGWSPFIPGDADNSSLPIGVFEYTFKNKSDKNLESVFSFNSANFIKINRKNSITPIKNGFVLNQQPSDDKPEREAHFAVWTDDNSKIDLCWFRGGWFDSMSMLWKKLSAGDISELPAVDNDSPGASLFVPFSLKPGESKTIKVNFAWYAANTKLKHGATQPQTCTTKKCCPSSGYQPWYSGKFKDLKEVVDYWNKNWKDLKNKSQIFSDSFYASTLPPEVMEAIAANLTILKSPTILRQKDGRLWGYEGCCYGWGCCHGSCTHVWNYAQAIPHLFPSLERSLRETEFKVSQNDEGHQTFRTPLPINKPKHDFYAAADGQLGGIMKVYRDWRIYGDTDWLKELWPYVKKSLDYCQITWDPKEKGYLEEPHHNTYDIEFWGPNGMCTSFYLGALTSIVEMGKALNKDVTKYETLLKKGVEFTNNELYDGEYFIHKIQWEGLEAKDPVELSKHSWTSNYSEEALKLLQKEGPKYQYGTGCLSDGVLGMWMASTSGLPEVLDNNKVTSHLKSIHKYNLKTDLRNHANPQRPTYAVGNEGGLLLCTWPKGGELSLPFVYSNEVWTGIEYQVASHLMMKGKVEEGLEIVRECRKRYDGQIRNPFNEYECGHWYARAMASYAMFQGLTGIRYDAVTQTLHIDSKIGDNFTSFLSTETGFGNVGLKNGKPFIDVKMGTINVKHFDYRP